MEIALVSIEIASGTISETCLKWEFGFPFPPKNGGLVSGIPMFF